MPCKQSNKMIHLSTNESRPQQLQKEQIISPPPRKKTKRIKLNDILASTWWRIRVVETKNEMIQNLNCKQFSLFEQLW